MHQSMHRGSMAELLQDSVNDPLRVFVISANEHGRLAAFEPGVNHVRTADGVEGLDQAQPGELRLQTLHQRLVQIREELDDAVDGRRVGDRIGRIDSGRASTDAAGSRH